jgi:hypothetical protein
MKQLRKKYPMQKKTTKLQTKPIDWEAVRVLAIELGAREAARRLGLKQSTVLSRASRDKWNLPRRNGGATLKSANAITLRSKPGDVLLQTHKELEERTKSGLAQATVRAAEAAAKAEKPVEVRSPSDLRDLGAAAARVFGWDAKGDVTVNAGQAVVVTPEQLRQIRMLREAPDFEASEPETSPQPVPYGPVDEELRITS